MSENYTAEDFAKASFARRGDGGRAARFAGDKWPWRASTADAAPWLSDEEMARDGWVPVVEDSEAIAGLRHNLALARKEMVDLREENDRLERILQAPLSLRDLEVAWEAAEEAGECRAGDVLILRDPVEGYSVWRAGDADYLAGSTRILSRAPREPWADLEDVLRNEIDLESDPGGIAHALHLKGWRKGGDDDE